MNLNTDKGQLSQVTEQLFIQEEIPQHIFNIVALNFSKDLLINPLSDKWFRMGAWTLDSLIKKDNVSDVISRQSILINQGDFKKLFDSLDAIGNSLSGIGEPGGTQTSIGDNFEYKYMPFHAYDFTAQEVVGEPLVFQGGLSKKFKLMISPDILLLFGLQEREGNEGAWWDDSTSTEVIRQYQIENGNCEVVDIRVSYLLKYLKLRQKALLVGHYRHLHLYNPVQSVIDNFVKEDITLGSSERGVKAIFNNWGFRKDFSEPYLQRRLHLWFQISPPEIDVVNPWAEEPPFDPYKFTFLTRTGSVAPGRWKSFAGKEMESFEGVGGDFLDRIYFKQEVLLKYENSSGIKVEDDGSVICKHHWALNRSTSRHGNELISMYIGDFAEGIPFEEWQHWKQYSSEYPTDEAIRALNSERVIPMVVNNLNRLLEELNRDFKTLADFQGKTIEDKLWTGSLDSLAGRQLKYVYLNNADEEEFIKRATLASTLVIDAISVKVLREVLSTFGANLHKSFADNSSLGSRKLFQRLALISLILIELRPDKEKISLYVKAAESSTTTTFPEIDDELLLELRGIQVRVYRLCSPLALLYDLRIHGGLAHPPNLEKARQTAQKLELPSQDWTRKHFIELVDKVSENIYAVSENIKMAIEIIAEEKMNLDNT